jgi:hypothetical protein
MYTSLSKHVSEKAKAQIMDLAQSMRPMQLKIISRQLSPFWHSRFFNNDQVFQALCLKYLNKDTVEGDAKELEMMSIFELQGLVAEALKEAYECDEYMKEKIMWEAHG